jgi:hypothetical protein
MPVAYEMPVVLKLEICIYFMITSCGRGVFSPESSKDTEADCSPAHQNINIPELLRRWYKEKQK